MLLALLLAFVQEPVDIRKAVEKAIPLLEKGAAGSMSERTCFTCHNLGAPVLALAAARDRGFKINEGRFKEILDHTESFLKKSRERYAQGKGQGGQADTAGWALWTLEVGGWKPDETTAAVAHYLTVYDKEKGYWKNVSNRPPSEASPFTTTFLGIAAMRTFAADKTAAGERIEKARGWLLASPPKDTEDRVFRLRALDYSGAEIKDIQTAAKELLTAQREDGGWAQLPEQQSDAYATGSVLAALVQAGGIAASDAAWRKGIAWLLRHQKDDGSWHVTSRSKPFQQYFETGFPHGKDQFISSHASSWAVVSLALACEKERKE
jgi:squalene cyclase